MPARGRAAPHAGLEHHEPRSVPRIGLISDTHGYLDPQVVEHFAGVDHIIHAGDIGWPSLLVALETVAPVTAVAGNTDDVAEWAATELLAIAGRRILVQHIVEPRRLADDLRGRMMRLKPDVVVFGHTHRPVNQLVDGVRYINPGSATTGRGGAGRSVAVLSWNGSGGTADLTVEFTSLRP